MNGSEAITAIERRPRGALRWRSSRWKPCSPEWYEQETIRGDFLRAIRQLQMNADAPLELEQYLAESHRAGTLAGAVSLADRTARDAVLREAASLGVDLLSGEEPHA